MSGDAFKLSRGLFGYRRRIVEQVLEDRDIMVRAAEERVRRSESRVHELEGVLESVRAQNARLESQMDRLGEQFDLLAARMDESIDADGAEQPPRPAEEEPPLDAGATDAQPAAASTLIAEELTSILVAGQEAAARMIERARDEAQRQIVEANRLLGDVHTGVRQFSSWRAEVQPAIARVQSFVEVVRNHIAQTPERVQNALAPLAEVMFAIDSELIELAGVSHSPFQEEDRGPQTGRGDEPAERSERVQGAARRIDDPIWLTVEEDHLVVAEGEEEQARLEASAS